MDWHYVQHGQDVGPVEQAELIRLVSSGALAVDTLVWRPGMSEWIPFQQALPRDPAQGYVAAEGLVRCSECGRDLPLEDTIEYGAKRICAACKPVFFQKVREGVESVPIMQFAGFWIRFGAWLIDTIVLRVVAIMVGLSALIPGMVFIAIPAQLVIVFGYETFFLGKFGQTPGKMALGLKVLRPGGEPLGYGLAFARVLSKILSAMIIGIGYMMAGWDDEKRALHDRICETRVIRIR